MTTIRHEWNLRQVMAKRGIYKITALGPLLEGYGFHLSSSQLHRLVTDNPERVNVNVMFALMRVLDCDVEELFGPTLVGERVAATGTDTQRRPTPLSNIIRENGLRSPRAMIPGEDDFQ